MNFASDNVVAAAPEVMEALVKANQGAAAPYGFDPLTVELERRFSDLFEHPVTIFPVATGTAANCLSIASLTPPWGIVYGEAGAHIAHDESTGPEFFTGGARIVLLPGKDGKLLPSALKPALHEASNRAIHHPQSAAVSLTQATEAGTVYTPGEIGEICDIAHAAGLKVHMDGARFANAVASLGCAPADVTWRAGVDVLSFGATKNGALAAEAIVYFNQEDAATLEFRRKRSGHLFSKMRFLSAQLEACIEDGRWLKWAEHANRMAARLSHGLRLLPAVRLLYPVDANELFLSLPEHMIAGLIADGFVFYRWNDVEGGAVVRLVTAWNTDQSDVDRLIERARHHAGLADAAQ
jgi:threonine aldolase